MTHETDVEAAARRDQQVERYILALDRGDFATVTTILEAAQASGLVDNKVASFSDTHTALRFVIPVALRPRA